MTRIQKVNGSLNNTVSRHPALVVAFISFLIAGTGAIIWGSLSMGYSHMMRRFDQFEAAFVKNDNDHKEIDRRLDDHNGRIIRLEASTLDASTKE